MVNKVEILQMVFGFIVSLLMTSVTLYKLYIDNVNRKKRDLEIDINQTKRLDAFENSLNTHIKSDIENQIVVKENNRQFLATMSNMENNLLELTELHKDSAKLPEILKSIEENYTKIIDIKKIENTEILDTLLSIKIYMKEFVIFVLSQSFRGLESDEILNMLNIKFKGVKSTINKEALDIKNPTHFIYEIDVIMTELRDKFVLNCMDIINKTFNGTRRVGFENLVVSYLRDVISIITSEYNKYKK